MAGLSPQHPIVHLDADAFFASVEQAADSRLRGRPVAVGGEKRGVIASASYEARRCGIYTPMPTVQARKLCPKLVLLPGDYEKYERFSKWMFSYCYDFTPEVEITSIDEGYFDLAGARRSPVEIARTIREAISQSLKISVSQGLGSNKLVSQIASKLHKPAAFIEVERGLEREFLHPLPNRWLPGVGPETATRFNAAGLTHIHHIAATPVELLALWAGRGARQLLQYANGVDDRPLVMESAEAKSYSMQRTFGADQTDEEHVEAMLQRMADELMARVRADHKTIRTVSVRVRYNDMDEEQRCHSLQEPTDLENDLYERVRVMLREAWSRRVSLRMVSLKLSNVYEGLFRMELPLEVETRRREAQRRLADTVDYLRQSRGHDSLMRGHDFVLREGPREESEVAKKKSALPEALRRDAERNRLRILRTPQPHIPLHAHSYYSFLDSILSPEALVELAKQQGMPALALTDQGNLHGAARFAIAAKAAGIKPIFGAEVQHAGHPLLLYVENATGYRHLCRLLTRGRDVTRETLEEFNGGLLAVSPWDEASAFFPGRFYHAVTAVPAPGKRVVASRFPVVYAAPVHYAAPEDRWKYDVVQSIRTLTLLREKHAEKRSGGTLHFRAWRELCADFAPDAAPLENTRELAARCQFEFPFGNPQFPSFQTPDGSPPGLFLRNLVLRGARERYGEKVESVMGQVEEELAIISDVGYEEYFLTVWAILQECRKKGIEWITRGSAADSLVCYCLRISDACPIRFDLYFRRFLNKERMQMNKLPDVDLDFPHDRKDDVVRLIFDMFGPERTAIVGGFSTFQARSAVGDVAKVLGVSEYQIRRFTERFPWSGASGIESKVRESLECRDLPLEEPCTTALRMADFLDGFPRYAKMHPCGVILSRDPMPDLTPTFPSSKGFPTSHYDMDVVEMMGLIKMDILAQGGLAVMRDVKEMLARRGIHVDLERLVDCKADHPFISPQ